MFTTSWCKCRKILNREENTNNVGIRYIKGLKVFQREGEGQKYKLSAYNSRNARRSVATAIPFYF
jgi:hypothetical protein